MLDVLLTVAETELRGAGVRVRDGSARTYHYKNSYLSWSYSFLKEWSVGSETARITISFGFSEIFDVADVPNIRVEARAELFPQGRPSRIDERSESKRTLAEIERLGIARVVLDAIRQCEWLLPAARS